MEQDNVLKERKEKFMKALKSGNLKWLPFLILAFIAGIGYYIRTRNLGYLIDATTGKYIPLALDPFVFLRYAKYLLEHGQLMAIDMMRYVPLGYSNISELSFLTYFIVYFYKFLHLFSPSMTLEYAHVLYPPVVFVVSLLFLFLFVRRVFDWRVGLLATAFIAVAPAYLYRTMAGFSDKESLAMFFLFLCLYLFIVYIQERKLKTKLIVATLSGAAMGCMGLIWGGVNFLFLIIGAFVLICVFFDKFSERDFYGYILFMILSFGLLWIGYPVKYSLLNLFNSTTSGFMVLAFGVVLVNYVVFQKDLLKIKNKIPFKLPSGITSTIFVLILIVVLGVSVYGIDFITARIGGLLAQLTNDPSSRWILTVAESHQPYFTDWIGQLSWKYIGLFYFGAVFLFYEIVKNVKEKYFLTSGFAVFLLLFSLSRYSSASVFNGETFTSNLAFVGSLVVFIIGLAWYYLDKFYNDSDGFEKFQRFDRSWIFVLIAFIFFLIGARTAIRLMFSFFPITAVLAGFLVFYLIDKAWKMKEEIYKYSIIVLVVLLACTVLYGYYDTSLGQSTYTGPSYNTQWQYAMDWVRDNTPEDAVFAHWWDYGYWVQTGGERATISDGGNARGAINYFTGRHLMTGQSDMEALELLAANNVTHVLMISDEIGKYSAYSSIGADENYDRYSWIPTMGLDMGNSQETRNGTTYAFVGGAALDDDFIYGDMLFPAYSSAVVAVLLPTETDGNGTLTITEQPTAVLNYNGMQYNVPLACVALNGVEITFNDEEDALQSCLYIMPTYNANQYNPIGAALYLSHDVWVSRFSQWYLMNNVGEYLELVHDDSTSGFPLMIYNGMIVGPLKIWEVSYPDNMDIPEEYYGTVEPEGVIEVKDGF